MNRIFLLDAAFLVLRLTLGAIFVAHGLQKLIGAFGGSGMTALVEMMKKIGMQPAAFWAWTLALSEVIGAIGLILGVLPRISGFLITVIMVVAIVRVHASQGFFAQQGGFEYQLLILAAAVFFILAGSGRFSLFNKF